MAKRIFTNEILGEFMRLYEVNLQTPLSLKAINSGHMESHPTPADFTTNDANGLVNGIWIAVDPIVRIERSLLPKVLQMTYNFRTVYVRKSALNENVDNLKNADARTIIEVILDNYALTNLSLENNGNILWSVVNELEVDPPEDAYVGQIASDLVAIAIRHEVVVRVRNV